MQIRSQVEADQTLLRIGRLQRDIKSEEILLNDGIESLTKLAETKVKPFRDELEAADEILLEYITRNKSEIASGPAKSITLTYGTIGVRDNPPVPAIMRGYHEEDVAKLLLKGGVKQCVKVSYRWIKNAVKNLPWDEERFAKFGIRMKQKKNVPFYTVDEAAITPLSSQERGRACPPEGGLARRRG